MKAQSFFEKELLPELPTRLADILEDLLPPWRTESQIDYCRCCESPGMGLGAGGRMKQEIYADRHEPQDWDMEHRSSCFVHLCDALLWREFTGENPPQTPVTAKEYERAGLPWFDYYRDDLAVLEGSKTLAIAVVFLIAGGIFPSKVLHWREEAAHSIEQALGLHHESAQ